MVFLLGTFSFWKFYSTSDRFLLSVRFVSFPPLPQQLKRSTLQGTSNTLAPLERAACFSSTLTGPEGMTILEYKNLWGVNQDVITFSF